MKADPRPKAFLVLGPEGSGTRWLTRLFLSCGCFGDGDHKQRLDREPPPADRHVVWRRSFPHGPGWPSVEALVDTAESWGREPIVICAIRDMYAITRSQRRLQSRCQKASLAKIHEAYESIIHGASLLELPFYMSIYDTHMKSEQYTANERGQPTEE